VNRYELTGQADEDMVVLHMQGSQQFGERQADRYHDELESLFHKLAEFPALARLRSEFDPPVRAYSYGSHVIVYEESAAGVTILRIRHGHEDWQNDPIGQPDDGSDHQ
jgi:toxin ParE1/3/4